MKSFVTIEQHKCMICCKDFDTNNLLLDQRMKDSFEKYTVTGWGICPECQKLADDGYTACVEIDKSKSEINTDGSYDPDKAYRTGRVFHVRNQPEFVQGVMTWIDQMTGNKLEAMYKQIEKE